MRGAGCSARPEPMRLPRRRYRMRYRCSTSNDLRVDERGRACVPGRVLSNAEIDELWEPWSPREVVRRMSRVAAPWYIAAGWALELFTADAARGHNDLEIAVPAARFGEVAAAFPGFEWDIVGDGRIWPFPDQ